MIKVSIITAVWNGAETIRDTIESVLSQQVGTDNQVSLEYIVVDGGSKDGTIEIINSYTNQLLPNSISYRTISEPDKGLYDAINKGIKMASGDVIGICNSDDVIAADDVVRKIANAFLAEKIDAVFADIRFVAGGKGVATLRNAPVTRYCTGKFFRRWMFRFATFPAHPSTFVKRECFEKFGVYSLKYKICADFELMLRMFYKHNISYRYLPFCTHVMRRGGLSTNGIRSNIQINREDLQALRDNDVWSCLILVYLKYFGKIWGFLFHKR